MRMRFEAALVSLAMLGSAALNAACVSEDKTRVERAQPYTTGNADYDAFFKQVNDLRVEAEKGEKEVAEARAALMKALALPEKADADETIQAAGERAKKLRDTGVLLHLDLTPAAKLAATKKRGGVAQKDALLLAVEDAAKLSLSLVKRFSEFDDRAAALEKKRAELKAKTRETFGFNASDIERELIASEEVIAKAAELGARHAGSASYFVLGLADAIDTAPPTPASVASRAAAGQALPGKGTKPVKAAAPKPAAPKAASQPPAPKPAAPKPAAPKPAAPKPAAPKPPASKPPPKGDDFEP